MRLPSKLRLALRRDLHQRLKVVLSFAPGRHGAVWHEQYNGRRRNQLSGNVVSQDFGRNFRIAASFLPTIRPWAGRLCGRERYGDLSPTSGLKRAGGCER
jgi:hypothetical protein